ncbi:hypothetical protein N9C74_01430 [Pontimonas sp.]|nr:hypothetical protein [Pontimonas sp.]
MTSTLTALLRQARADRAVLGVFLKTGHYREIHVRAVGDVWFSARTTGAVSSEILVSHNAVRTLTGLSEQEEPGEELSGHPPLRVMLAQLQRQGTRLVLHCSGSSISGRIAAVGKDFLIYQKADEGRVVVPLGGFLWLEACG